MAVGQSGVQTMPGAERAAASSGILRQGEALEGGLFVRKRMKRSSLRIVRTQIKRFNRLRLAGYDLIIRFQTHENIRVAWQRTEKKERRKEGKNKAEERGEKQRDEERKREKKEETQT